MPRFSAKPSTVIRRPEIASSRLRGSTRSVMLWISFSSLKKVPLNLYSNGSSLQLAGGSGGRCRCAAAVGAGRRAAGGRRAGCRRCRRAPDAAGAAPSAGGSPPQRLPAAAVAAAVPRRPCSVLVDLQLDRAEVDVRLRRGVVQLDQQRGHVLVGGHGLAEAAEAGVQRRERDLCLRELDLLLLGLVQRLACRGDVLVELGELAALRRQAHEPEGSEQPTHGDDDQRCSVSRASLVLPPAAEAALLRAGGRGRRRRRPRRPAHRRPARRLRRRRVAPPNSTSMSNLVTR